MKKRNVIYLISSGILLSLISVENVAAEELESVNYELVSLDKDDKANGISLNDFFLHNEVDTETLPIEIQNALENLYITYGDSENILFFGETNLPFELTVWINETDYIEINADENNYFASEFEKEGFSNIKIKALETGSQFSELTLTNKEVKSLINLEVDPQNIPDEQSDVIEPEEPKIEQSQKDEVIEIPKEIAPNEDVKSEIEELETNQSEKTEVIEKPKVVEEVIEPELTKPNSNSSEILLQEKSISVFSIKAKAVTPIPSSGLYIVKSGDTLSKIGLKYGVSYSNIAKWSGIKVNSILSVGQKLVLDPTKIKAVPTNGIYAVVKGDTLNSIADDFGISLAQIAVWNGISKSGISNIKIGQKLAVSKKGVENQLSAVEKSKLYKDSDSLFSQQKFIDYIAPIAMKYANILGKEPLYASVIIAQAAHESNYGNSGLSNPPNYNLTGIKGSYNGAYTLMWTWEHDSSFNADVDVIAKFKKYPSYDASIKDNTDLIRNGPNWNTKYYSGAWVKNASNYKEATAALDGRYATDASGYANKLNAIIEKYKLYKYDTDYKNTLNGWHVVNGIERYYTYGKYSTGLNKVGSTTYLFDGSGKKQYGWHKVNGKDMYFNESNGGLWTGKRKIGNTTYLFDSKGQKQYGWHRLNGKDYYFNIKNGGMWTGKREVGNTTYLFKSSGEKVYGWFLDSANKKYYFNESNGGMLTGLRKVGNAYYYFDTTHGNAVVNNTKMINGQKWSFNKQGIGKKN